MTDPQVIYLEPFCCSNEDLGRSWSSNPDVFDCESGNSPTKYVRADLTNVVELQALLARATEFQFNTHIIRKADLTWLLFDEKRNLVLPQYRFDSLEDAIEAIKERSNEQSEQFFSILICMNGGVTPTIGQRIRLAGAQEDG